MKFTILCIFFICSTLFATGQGGFVPPKVPEKTCKDLANARLNADAGYTDQSVEEITEMIRKYPTWTEAYHQLSRIYYQAGMKAEAIETLENSLAIDTASQLPQLYTIARLYEETGNVLKAADTYHALLRQQNLPDDLFVRTTESLEDLQMKLDLLESDYTISLVPLPEEINTSGEEALGRWTLDGKSIIYTRYIDRQEDLFTATIEEGIVLDISPLPFNTPQDEGGHAISPDGKYIIFSSERRDGLGSYDLYLSVFRDSVWQTPVNMGPAFNSPGWDAQPCFGLDGKTIYFSSSRVGGEGGRDIWFVREMASGKWSKPQNAGPAINTSANEESPYIHFDGRTMYFMRDGAGGLGGYDLYFAQTGIDGKWQVAVNMKSPVNSFEDEGALSLHPDGVHALITRNTEERKNDLFSFELPAQFHSTPVMALHAFTLDAITGLPVKAKLDIVDVSGNDTVRVSQTADETGLITVTLERNKSYGFVASADHYILQSSFIDVDTSSVLEKKILLTPVSSAVNTTTVLNNIFFETGSARLLKISATELGRLERILKENPAMRIEIRGHTDHVGSDADNQVLSEERAKAVYQHLIDKGIDPARLSYKGFGESMPLASNETSEGRRQNRRTEFVILAN